MSRGRLVSIRFGAEAVPLAPDTVVEALFATISYRLEPKGWATRFPVVLERLHEGRLDAASADAALSELERIAAELKEVPVDRVVWSMQDLRRREDSNEPVRRTAPNAYEYFVARDGRPIVAWFTDSIRRSRMSDDALTLDSGLRRREIMAGLFLFSVGAAIGIGGYVYFPDAILVPEEVRSEASRHGPLMWPVGCCLAAIGFFGTFGALFPSFGSWMRRRAVVIAVALVAVLGAVGYAAWR